MKDNKQHQGCTPSHSNNAELYVQIGLILLLVAFISFNFGRLYTLDNLPGNGVPSTDNKIIPTGVPAVYGAEMGVSYDDVSAKNPTLADATITKLSSYEDMQLNEAQMQRYKKIASSISCEYCCGAAALIFSSGERACGCAHSYSMRGLAKYLLIKHADMSDEAILSELGKWKVLFFPEIHRQKAQVLEAQGIDSTNYINLASNLYRGIEKGKTSGGSMVGGC